MATSASCVAGGRLEGRQSGVEVRAGTVVAPTAPDQARGVLDAGDLELAVLAAGPVEAQQVPGAAAIGEGPGLDEASDAPVA